MYRSGNKFPSGFSSPNEYDLCYQFFMVLSWQSPPAYGRLSVMLQYRFQIEKLLEVLPEFFRPSPKVDSAIVRMTPLPASDILVQNKKLFAQIVVAAFWQRRKTLRNTLKAYLTEDDFIRLGMGAQLRAENLGVAEFARITTECS